MNALSLIPEEEDRITTNPTKKKNKLKVRVIRYLHQNGKQSIPDLCHVVRVSAPTMKRLLEELMKENLVKVLGLGESVGGRRPYNYDLNPDSRVVIGLDLARYETKMGLFNMACQPLTEPQVFAEGLETSDDVVGMLVKQIGKLLKTRKIKKELVLGVGVSLPGLIDIKTGISHSYLNYDQEPLSNVLSAKFDLPTFIEHDTRALARGELMFGQARGRRNVLCLNLGAGIGLSIIVEGRVYQGTSGYAGEFGHINVDPEGELCYCGKKGCLETLASGRTLRQKVITDLKSGKKSMLMDMAGNDPGKVKLPLILEAALAGDQYASELISETAGHLGKGIATLIHLFNPELIILGGMMASVGNLLSDPIQQALNTYCMPRVRQDTEVVISSLADNASLMGSVALVIDNILDKKP